MSEEKVYRLIETEDWNALQISGILMHRIEGTTPKKDAEAKVKALGKIRGNVLDICTGLGYTAILLARKKSVEQVITIEKDEKVIEIAKQNPYSKELFENRKIKLLIGDAAKLIRTFKENSFDAILHDPPRISIAGELYSQEFYKELARVLKPGKKLFHYTGMPGKHSNKRFLKGIKNRLMQAGFGKVRYLEKPQGFLCELSFKIDKML